MNAPDQHLPTPTLADIEAGCRAMGAARDKLRAIVEAMQGEINRTTDRYRRRLQDAIDDVSNEHERLLAQVQAAPKLFVKPRSAQFHGVKCGWQKGKGGIEYGDEARVCQLIERHLPRQADSLIKTTRKPIAGAIAGLDVRDLKRIGCTVKNAGDAAFVKPVDSELDKTVKRLIDDATREEGES